MELFLNAEIPEEPQNTIEGGVGAQHYPDLTDSEIKRIMTAIEMEDNETLTNSFAGGGESYESLLDFTYHPIEEEKKEEDDEDDNSDTSSFSIFNIRDTQDWDENDFTGGKFSYKNKKRTKRNNKKKNKNKTKRNNKNKNKTKRNNKKKNRTKRKVKR